MYSRDEIEAFERLESYPWADDQEFQAGLTSILASVANSDQTRHLTLRARCFYFERQALGISSYSLENAHDLHRKFDILVDFPAYQAWFSELRSSRSESSAPRRSTSRHQESLSTHPATHETSAAIEQTSAASIAPYPVPFSHIVELITTGQPIPGIRDIPDTLLEGQASLPTRRGRKKPWERGDEDDNAQAITG